MSVLPDPRLAALLERMHARSAGETQALAAENCRLALVDIDPAGLEATRRLIAGVPVSTHVASVADRERMARFDGLAEAAAAGGDPYAAALGVRPGSAHQAGFTCWPPMIRPAVLVPEVPALSRVVAR